MRSSRGLGSMHFRVFLSRSFAACTCVTIALRLRSGDAPHQGPKHTSSFNGVWERLYRFLIAQWPCQDQCHPTTASYGEFRRPSICPITWRLRFQGSDPCFANPVQDKNGCSKFVRLFRRKPTLHLFPELALNQACGMLRSCVPAFFGET